MDLVHDSHPSDVMGPWFIRFMVNNGYHKLHPATKEAYEVIRIVRNLPRSSRLELSMLLDSSLRGSDFREHATEWYANLPSANKRTLKLFYHKKKGFSLLNNDLGDNGRTIPVGGDHSSDTERQLSEIAESTAPPDNPDVLATVEGGHEFMNLLVDTGRCSDEIARHFFFSMWFSGTLTEDGWSSYVDASSASQQTANRIFDNMSPTVLGQLVEIRTAFRVGQTTELMQVNWWENIVTAETKDAIKKLCIIGFGVESSGTSFDPLGETLGTMAADLNQQKNPEDLEVGTETPESTLIGSTSIDLSEQATAIQNAFDIQEALENLTAATQTNQALEAVLKTKSVTIRETSLWSGLELDGTGGEVEGFIDSFFSCFEGGG